MVKDINKMGKDINKLVKPINDIVTIIVQNKKGEIVHDVNPIRTNFVRAIKIREILEKRFPFPDFEILEFVSDEEEYIYTDVIAGHKAICQTIKEEMSKSLKEESIKESKDDEKIELLTKLKAAHEQGNFQGANAICGELRDKYRRDLDVAKSVAKVYSLQPEKLEEGIEWLTSLTETNDTETLAILAGLHLENREASKAAYYYEKAADLESKMEQRARYRSRAAYTFWEDQQHTDAVRAGKKALEEWKVTGNKSEIRNAKNSVSYYCAELGKHLDQALEYSLELLGISIKSDYVKEIKTRNFAKGEAQFIDTVGRILESKGKLLDALRVFIRAKQLNPHNPVLLKNLERIHEKIKEW